MMNSAVQEIGIPIKNNFCLAVDSPGHSVRNFGIGNYTELFHKILRDRFTTVPFIENECANVCARFSA